MSNSSDRIDRQPTIDGGPVVENPAFTAFAARIISAAGRRVSRGDIGALPELVALPSFDPTRSPAAAGVPTVLCALPGCRLPVPRAPIGRPAKYCGKLHSRAAYRARRRERIAAEERQARAEREQLDDQARTVAAARLVELVTSTPAVVGIIADWAAPRRRNIARIRESPRGSGDLDTLHSLARYIGLCQVARTCTPSPAPPTPLDRALGKASPNSIT